jgi:hypothetical protein
MVEGKRDSMELVELPDTLAEKIECLIRPILQAYPAETSRQSAATSDSQVQWQTVTAQLEKWKSDPDAVADEGVLPPSATLLACAQDVAGVLRGAGVDAPDTLMTNGDGGVVFRWQLHGRTWSIEMDVDGSVESSLIGDGALLWRHSLYERL